MRWGEKRMTVLEKDTSLTMKGMGMTTKYCAVGCKRSELVMFLFYKTLVLKNSLFKALSSSFYMCSQM